MLNTIEQYIPSKTGLLARLCNTRSRMADDKSSLVVVCTLFSLVCLVAEATRGKYTYGNPIARKGKVVQIGASRGAHRQATPPQSMQHPVYAYPVRRIRDPIAARYHSPRIYPQEQQFIHPYLGPVGAGSTPSFQQSPQTMGYPPGQPNQQARYSSAERVSMAPPLIRSHPHSPYEGFNQHYDTPQLESVVMRMHSVGTIPHQKSLHGGQPKITRAPPPPPGFERFRKRIRVDEFFDPMELQWEDKHLEQELKDTQSTTGSFAPSVEPPAPVLPVARSNADPFAESRLRVTLPGPYEKTQEVLVPPLSASRHQSVPSAATHIGALSHILGHPIASMSHQQSSVEANNWEILSEIPPTPRIKSLSTFKTMESFPVDQEESLSLDWENLGDRNNAGLSRFQQPTQDNSVSVDQHVRYLQPQSRTAFPEMLPRSRDVASHSQDPTQQDRDFNIPPPLRFFNEGVEVDIHGRPLSSPGSRGCPHLKIPAAFHALGVTGFPIDDSWNEFFQ